MRVTIFSSSIMMPYEGRFGTNEFTYGRLTSVPGLLVNKGMGTLEGYWTISHAQSGYAVLTTEWKYLRLALSMLAPTNWDRAAKLLVRDKRAQSLAKRALRKYGV